MATNQYLQYLQALNRPIEKLAKLEFLQPDNSVAFILDNNYKRGYSTKYDSRAFIESGSLSVNLQNGTRRKATITLANIDKAFDFAINKLWFGQKIRLSMGIKLPDGTDFYLPQGVFYLSSPQNSIQPDQRTITYNLVDKWAYLDGSLFGKIENVYQVNRGTNLFEAVQTILNLSKKDFSNNADDYWKIDNVLPVFTNYYNNKYYSVLGKDIWDGTTDGNALILFNVQTGYTVPQGTGTGWYSNLGSIQLNAGTYYFTATGKNTQGLLRITSNISYSSGIIAGLQSIPFNTQVKVEISTPTTIYLHYNNNGATTQANFSFMATLRESTSQNMASTPYNVTAGSADGGTFAEILLELNTTIAGWIGYDHTGALRIEPSQDDINDGDKAVLWNFTPENSQLLGITETYNNKDVANDIKIIGENLTGGVVWGRAQNFDPKSDTNINIIGDRLYKESRASYWNSQQCVELARFMLKRKTVLQKSITVESEQLFHLYENGLVSIKRTDKDGSPVERHLIQSYSIPIASSGKMSIQAISVNELDIDATITSSDSAITNNGGGQ